MLLLDELLDSYVIWNLINYISYIIFSFLGSIIKEIYNTNTIDDHEFQASNVVTSTLIGSMGTFALREYYTELYTHWGTTALISLIIGFIGFELFCNISTISGLTRMVKALRDFLANNDSDKLESISNKETIQPEKIIDNSINNAKKKAVVNAQQVAPKPILQSKPQQKIFTNNVIVRDPKNKVDDDDN